MGSCSSKKSAIIGITMDINGENLRIKHHYITAIERAGSLPLLLPPSISYFSVIKDLIDGLIIPGGGDIPTDFYGEKPEAKNLRPVSRKRTAFELKVLEEFIKLKKPVLGICYGMQLINVFFGGSLYQDIKGHAKGYHDIIIEENILIPKGTYRVNSSHHQAIKQNGNGINVFGLSQDEIIEAITHIEHKQIFGIQWHPERMNDSISKKIFKNFFILSLKDKDYEEK